MADDVIIDDNSSDWDEYDAWCDEMRRRMGDEAWETALEQHALDARTATYSAPGTH